MPPVNGVSTANHQAQRWMDSIVALNPIVQRQNSAARSEAVPRSVICSISRSPPNRLTARMVAPCIAKSSAEPYRRRSTACGTGCRRGCRSESRTRRSSQGAGRCRTAPPRPVAQQQGTEQTEHKIQPQGGSKRPGDVRTHAELTSPGVHASPPQQQRNRQEQTGDLHQHPGSRVQDPDRWRVQRLEGQPEQLANELDRIQFTDASILKPMMLKASVPKMIDARPSPPR